jgi:Xaa-Pro aminopeptidase
MRHNADSREEADMDASTFIERRGALRKAVPDGAILIMGNDEAPKNYLDNPYPFRQDSHFLYYVGVARPGMAALLVPGGHDALYGPADHPDDVVWHGPHPVVADHAKASGFDRHAPIEALADVLEELIRSGVEVHFLPPYRDARRMRLAALLGRDPRDVDTGVSRALVRAVAAQRSVKSNAEVAEMESALEVTAAMYDAAFRGVRAGRTESEIAAVIQAEALKHDRQQAFTPIVSVRGEVLHNHSYANTMADGDLLVIDSGAESPWGYASDITRTLPVAGRFDERQRQVYDVVLAAQTAAIDAAAPGVTNRELHLLAARTVADGLIDLGLMRGDADAAVAAGAHALFFVHGLGHMLGLDAHDMEDLGDIVGYPEGEARSEQFGLNFLRLARPLEPGWVITVEPGIYFIPALYERWRDRGHCAEFIDYDRVATYLGFGGIRIEDDVLITGDGHRVLGPGIPKAAGDVERAMAGA